MSVIVQKFGGTSVAAEDGRLAALRHVESALAKGYQVVVVVSAMGRQGDPYATDTLLGLIPDRQGTPPRDLDLLMSCGEVISAVVFAALLRGRGHEVAVLTGPQAGIRTTAEHGRARILEIRADRIREELRDGKVVVVAGFQGATETGEVTTLGRGGSDTTAAALGVALDASYVDIFTDVDGIMTADPRIVENARLLPQVTYTEICNLAYQGAKVIHPRAVEIAMQKNIPIRVRSTRSDDEGTLVVPAADVLETRAVADRLLTGVAHVPHLTQIRLEGPGARHHVFDAMARHGISVDFISVEPGRISFTVPDAEAPGALAVLRDLGMEAKTTPGCAKVSAVGAGMAGVPGVMARIVEALAAEGIEVLQSADSHTTIWCLVRGEDMETAVKALHRAFGLGQAPESATVRR
ncbi:aspartate kinase [Alicyclobacillus kakegawensis]|uniref:aspartate kinase n=1 Tax=Alicyclobacillus kakegawensis TaxID=392012 RepID=UPI00082D1624|nr:aspartate kinase [Alicyclobacillus kakegawensis]